MRSSSALAIALSGLVATVAAATAMVIGPVGADGAAQPTLFSVAAHDQLRNDTAPCDKGSTVGEENCLAHQTIALDRQIDATAAQILLADNRVETGPGAVLTAAAATSDLSAAQRAWLAFRARDCRSWSDPNAGGTIVGIDFGECAVRDGRTRLAELHSQLTAAGQP
jgi:uncharacterized protein YecT (DUF1311 family)